jgi:uncharacterized protein
VSAPGGPRPFRIGVAELLRRPGSRRDVHVVAPLPSLAMSSSRVPEHAEISVDVVLESIADGVLTVTGVVRAPWTGECRRCLQPVEGTMEASVRELYAREPLDEETYPLDGDHVDLGAMAHDAVLLNLPLAPLCRPDCSGPDPDAYPVEAESDEAGGGDTPTAPRDPRWAALDELRFGD